MHLPNLFFNPIYKDNIEKTQVHSWLQKRLVKNGMMRMQESFSDVKITTASFSLQNLHLHMMKLLVKRIYKKQRISPSFSFDESFPLYDESPNHHNVQVEKVAEIIEESFQLESSSLETFLYPQFYIYADDIFDQMNPSALVDPCMDPCDHVAHLLQSTLNEFIQFIRDGHSQSFYPFEQCM